jgi:integrase
MNKRKRSGYGMGYLYKVSHNKEYPANHKIQGKYWLQIKVEGKKKRIPLKNEYGERIIDYDEAKQIRKQFIAPLLLGERKNVFEFLKTSMNELETEKTTSSYVSNNILDGKASDIKICDALMEYKRLLLLEKLSKLHMDNNLASCKVFIEHMQTVNHTKIYLSEITSDDINKYIESKLSRFAPKTYNHKRIALQKFFNVMLVKYAEAHREYKIPTINIKRKPINYSNSFSRRVLSSNELQRILQEASKINNELYVLFLIGITTGLRLGDCISLKWDEVDILNGFIKRIPNKTQRYCKKPLIIGIVDILKNELQKLPKDKEYVLNLHNTKRHIIEYNIKKVFINSGIPMTKERKEGMNNVSVVGFHSLRHTFISKHAEMGTPLAVVQEAVGHSQAAMTQHYIQIQEQKVKDAALNFKI